MKNGQPRQARHPQADGQYPPDYYEIIVQGKLDNLWEKWFEGMTLTHIENGESEAACTLISGQVADQSELHGLLTKIRDLSLTLISVRRTSPQTNKTEEVDVDLN